MKNTCIRIWIMVLCVVMLVTMLPVNASAAIRYNANATTDDYYKLISQKEWQIAPGIEETEVVMNTSAGTRRQVVHTAKIDMNNPYTKVIPGYKGMIPEAGNYGTESTSTQALNAEKLGYGNVVVATNALLSWYNEDYYKKQHPELIGEPLGYSILDGQYYSNSRGQTGGMSGGSSNGQLVINYDVNPTTGETRPDSMPKVQMRSCGEALTGWEQYSFSCWQWLVKPDANGNPQIQVGKNHSDAESRTWIGVTAEGEIILSVCDGGQAPYSYGLSLYEEADYLVKMGCIYGCNLDGGGSTTFCTQRPGEDLKVNCSLADGGERPTTNTILVMTTAPDTDAFAQATISSQYDYYTPGSTVEFTALGTNATGKKVAIPEDAVWTIKEDGMGSIQNGVFTSNGTAGTVTAQMVYDGAVVGEHTIHLAVPDKIAFDQPVVTIPYGKTVTIPAKASIDNGMYTIGVGANDITYTIDNAAIGSFSGAQFTAVEEKDAPVNLVGNVTATLNMGNKPTATVQFKIGKGSEVLWDFEDGQSDVDEWNVTNNRTGTQWAYDLDLSLATREDGQVHDGNYSMRLVTNGLHSKDSHSEQYAYVRLGVDGAARILENARSVGFWLYVPEDNVQCWVHGYYKYDSDGDGVLDSNAEVNLMDSENVYYNIDESGWHYLSMDVSAYSKIALQYKNQFDKGDGSGEKGEFFMDIVFHKAINNILWQTSGSINGQYTYYLDNFTVDYSDAVDDREEPVIGKIYLDGDTALVKRDVVTTTSNTLNLSAEVADTTVKKDAEKVEHPLVNVSGIDVDSTKVYVDGVLVGSTYANGVLSASVNVADGYHRVKFEACDNAGNKAVVIRVVKVESGVEASTLKLVPADDTLDRIPFGSIYWMNLEANKIETIQKVEAVIDLNNVNHWQLNHMEPAVGFTADYTIDEETNTANITITRTGNNDMTGEAVLAKIPVRIVDFDNDMQIPGYNAQTVWTNYLFWPQDMKMDVDKGVVTYVDGYTSDVLNTFSNEEFHVDTEMYTNMAAMDKTYWSAHGTTHVHTPVAIADKAATCTEYGYTGRTFCEECNSPVDWGESIAPTGHNYELQDGKFICTNDNCGKELELGTGLFKLNGKNYYAIGGSLVKGWQRVDDDWYYFDEDYAGISGKRTFDGREYNFEDGCVEGIWQYDGVGTRYYYGPSYYYNVGRSQSSNFVWETIDGKKYAFDRKGYRYEGYAVLTDAGYNSTLYQFTDDGVLIGEADTNGYTGIFVCKKTTTYLKDGKPFAAGLVKNGNDYYYINSGCEAVVGNYDVTRPNGLLLPGFYQFGMDGKMINPPVYEDGPNSNGYFYMDGMRLSAYQLVKFEGDYYFITDYSKYATNTTLYLTAEFVEGTGLSAGYYYFDKTGKLSIKNGPDADGYFYLNGVMQKAYQLIAFEGNYYFVYDANKYAKNTTLYLTSQFVEGTGLAVGYYQFDETGKIVLKNGPDADGYFYLNGVKQKAYQLIAFEGNYYFVYDANKYAKNTTLYLTSQFVEGTGLAVGYYQFDETGKIVLKNGPDADGYFYLNGVKQKAYQLIAFEGNYYFVYDSNKYAKNTTLYLTAQYAKVAGLTVGYYNFDAEGKLVLSHPEAKNGPDADGYFYLNGVKQKAYQLIAFEGNYYFVYDSNKYAKNTTLYLTSQFVEGTGLAVGYYQFDETGKLVLRNGPDADGYFYLNNIKQKAYQLIKFEDAYYFVYDSNKYAKNTTLYLTSQFVEGTGLAVGYYDFDADGKIIMKNGPGTDGYFYLNGTKVARHTFVKYEGDYYYVAADGKYVTNKWQYTGISDKAYEGTDLRNWHHSFDNEGKMIGYYEGLPNGRDIGEIYNLKTTDGKSIKSGLLIRGCELDQANYYYPQDMIDLGIERLKNEFHVKFDMDLRNSAVVGQDVFDEDVIHKTYNMVLYTDAFTEDGKAKMKEVFTDLANPDNYPIYMHCTHGVDRTGTVSFFLEAVLGVPYQPAVYEYTLSVGSYGQKIVDVYNMLNKQYSGATLKDKAEAYLKDCGITQTQIDTLRDIYLEK